MLKYVRVLETGVNRDGQSAVVSDTHVDAQELPTGRILNPLWRRDGLAGASGRESSDGLFPSAGGVRFWLFTVRAHEQNGDLGLHQTQTVDLGLVVSGVVTLQLSDGSATDLYEGDTFVQNGTLHGWMNSGDTDATIALVVLGNPTS